jgi:hypothetical protein
LPTASCDPLRPTDYRCRTNQAHWTDKHSAMSGLHAALA